MRALEYSRLIASIALCLHGCVQLPTIGFGVRSTFRTRERPAGRSVELLTGVTVGWAAARRGAQPTEPADGVQHQSATAAYARDDTQLPCAESVFCTWENDQRQAALEREGVSDVAEGVVR